MTIKEFNAQPLRPDRLLATVRYYSDNDKRGRVIERVPIIPCYNGDKLMRLKLRTFYVCLDGIENGPALAAQYYHCTHKKKIILNVDLMDDYICPPAFSLMKKKEDENEEAN